MTLVPRRSRRFDLGAKRSVGVHWGTFERSDEPLHHPSLALADARRQHSVTADEFSLMAVGETRLVPARMRVS